MTWNEEAAWKLALEGHRRVRQLFLRPDDGRHGDTNVKRGCVVPFDRLAVGMGDSKGGGERTALSLCLEASHSAPRIA
jgi:hypothetical protein